MEYRQKAPPGLIPINLPDQNKITHFIDTQEQIWWYCVRACRIYGRKFVKGYYLKEPTYIIGSQRYTLTDLKELAQKSG